MLKNTLFIGFENEGAFLGERFKKKLEKPIDIISLHTIQRTWGDDSTWECVIEEDYHPFSGRTSVWSHTSAAFDNFTHDSKAQNIIVETLKKGHWDNIVLIAPAISMVAVDAFAIGIPWLCSLVAPIVSNITIATVFPAKDGMLYEDAIKGVCKIKQVNAKINIENAEYFWPKRDNPDDFKEHISQDMHDAFYQCIDMILEWTI